MSRTLTLEGDVNAVDTLTRLTQQGSVSAPSLVVPSGVTRIMAIYAAVAGDGQAAGQAAFFVRLGGNSVQNGEQTIAVGGAGNIAVQSGADAAPMATIPFELLDADIEVNPSDVITVAGEFSGADIGDGTIGITLVFA